jgi:thioester reductase-like protein
VERKLADIWAQLLRVDQVGVQDNFFELGGHSLLALKAMSKTNQCFGCSLKVTDAYKSPTIRQLAERVRGTESEDDLIDLSREAALPDNFVAQSTGPSTSANAVMLTGGTGFVGRFLLAQLLQETDATIYCMVRASSQHQATLRLRTTLAKWDLWREEFESRIIGIPGDLRLPNFGLDDHTYQLLAREVDCVFHCATSMNHLETYAMAKQANVASAVELLRFSTTERPKTINYISTLGVFSSSTTESDRVVSEETPIDFEKHWNSRGYVASKWVGEKIFLTANDRGIPCNVFRLGLVCADTQRGRYDELQREYRVIKSCLLSGFGIQDYRYEWAPTPVDYVARSVVWLARRHRDGKGVFHITSADQMEDGLFERCNEIANTSLKLVPLFDWICMIKRLHEDGRSLPIVPLIEYAFSMDQESFHRHRGHTKRVNTRIDCFRTHRELENAGIVAPVLGDDALRMCLASIFERDEELRESTKYQRNRAAMTRNMRTIGEDA